MKAITFKKALYLVYATWQLVSKPFNTFSLKRPEDLRLNVGSKRIKNIALGHVIMF